MRSLASPRTQADEELGSPTYQQYGAWGAAAAGPYDSVGSLESSPRWSQGDDLGSQASSPREELPSYRSADDATPEVSLGTPSRPACTCTIGSHSAGCSEADSISGCHNGGNGGSSPQWVSSPTWSHRESPRGDSADDQKRTTGMDERLRRGLVVSVAPNGPHGTLRDLIFYLCNNHVSLAAISPTFADEVPMICSCPDHDLPLASGTPLRHRLCPRGPPVLGTAAPPCTAQLSGIRFLSRMPRGHRHDVVRSRARPVAPAQYRLARPPLWRLHRAPPVRPWSRQP